MTSVARFYFDEAWSGAGSEAGPPDDPWQPPEILTAREVCELPLPEGQEILGPLIMAGSRLVIGGKSGEGKTTLVMQMVSAVTTAGEFLGWTGSGGRALVLDLEQGLRTVQRRLREASLDESGAVDYVRLPDGMALDSDPAQQEWLSRLIEDKRYHLVILDPLYKAHQGDSNDERSMVDLMRRLDRLRDDHQFALLIPMHLRKLDPRATTIGMDDIFGSGGLTRGAEVVLGIRKRHPGRSVLHFWKDRDGDLQEYDKWQLDFSVERGFERAPDDHREPCDQLIIRALSASHELSRKELEKATGYGEKTVRISIARLEEDGTVNHREAEHGRRLYRLEQVPDDDLGRYENMALEKWE